MLVKSLMLVGDERATGRILKDLEVVEGRR
jgi:hypothetical protein